MPIRESRFAAALLTPSDQIPRFLGANIDDDSFYLPSLAYLVGPCCIGHGRLAVGLCRRAGAAGAAGVAGAAGDGVGGDGVLALAAGRAGDDSSITFSTS